MNKLKSFLRYLSVGEWCLWGVSIALILCSYFCFEGQSVLKLCASLVGATALIFNAKGNPLGMALIIVFSGLYGVISFQAKYYGEMITYVCMSAPMAAYSLIMWLKHPFQGKKSQVQVNRIGKKDFLVICLATCAVTVIFFFILKYLHTSSLLVSTFSVTTSFFAVCFTAKRSPYFALAYAFNDIVLIILWSIAAAKDISYLSVIICFVAFLANDIYSFISWLKMQKRQNQIKEQAGE